jgi:transmembrane sensor
MIRVHERVEEAAAQWLVRLDRELPPEELYAFENWCNESPRHRAAFLRLSTAWRRADALRRLAQSGAPADPDLLAPERPPASESLTEPPPVKPPRAGMSRRAFGYALAAGAAGLTLGTAVWVIDRFTGGDTYTTHVGDFQRVMLKDGSWLALNTDTKVIVRYVANQRTLQLVHGEALFEVKPDPQRPFVVSAGEMVIRAVGTAFSVRLHDDGRVDVLVAEGKVAINPPSGRTLSAGERALLTPHDIVTSILLPEEAVRHHAWLEGRIVFKAHTLAAAATEFNRYNHTRLVVADPSIADLKIGGGFKATDPEGFAAALESMSDVRAHTQAGPHGPEIHLTRRSSTRGTSP